MQRISSPHSSIDNIEASASNVASPSPGRILDDQDGFSVSQDQQRFIYESKLDQDLRISEEERKEIVNSAVDVKLETPKEYQC